MGAEVTKPREQFGNYLVFERVGMGGMATVHRAIRRGIEGFEQVVALKRLLPHLAEDAGFVAAFIREAKLAAMLQHQRIVHIYDLGRVDGNYYIAMEYIEGSDLRELLRCAHRLGAPPPLDVTLSILGELCEGLDYAHSRVDNDGRPLALVHRDVSPSNLLIAATGNLKVIDFGIAKAATAELRTDSGRVRGKCPYMSPEAVQGRELDARSDIFSTGVIAHELLTAKPLFGSKNEYETLTKVQFAEVFPPSVINPECPLEVDDVVLRALEKDPDRRWPSAAAMREALQEAARVHRIYPSSRQVATWLADARRRMAAELATVAAPSDTVKTLPAARPEPSAARPEPSVPARARRISNAPPVVVVAGEEGAPALSAEDEVVRIVWGHGRGVASIDGDEGGLPTADDLEVPLPPVREERQRRASTSPPVSPEGRPRRASAPPKLGPELRADAKLVEAPAPEEVNITFRNADPDAADDEEEARPTRKLVLIAAPTPPPGPPPEPPPVSEPPPPLAVATPEPPSTAPPEPADAVPRLRMPRVLSAPVQIGSLDLKPPGPEPTRARGRAESVPPVPGRARDERGASGTSPLVIALAAAIAVVVAGIVYLLVS